MKTTRIERIANLAGVSYSIAESYIFADWDNQDEHQVWLEIATDEEIADWLRSCTSHGEVD